MSRSSPTPARQTAAPRDEAPSDAELVDAVVAGDARAFECLYRRYHAPLYRTALALTRRRSVAEELLQETFLRAYRYLGRIRMAGRTSLRPWLHQILVHLVYDWSARHRPASSSLEDALERLASPLLSPERTAEQRELARTIGEALHALPLKQRAAVVLYYLHDMEIEEISAATGVPEGTVKSRLYYGRARLRARLAADGRLAALPASAAAKLQPSA